MSSGKRGNGRRAACPEKRISDICVEFDCYFTIFKPDK
jgi:hypothetical protein